MKWNKEDGGSLELTEMTDLHVINSFRYSVRRADHPSIRAMVGEIERRGLKVQGAEMWKKLLEEVGEPVFRSHEENRLDNNRFVGSVIRDAARRGHPLCGEVMDLENQFRYLGLPDIVDGGNEVLDGNYWHDDREDYEQDI